MTGIRPPSPAPNVRTAAPEGRRTRVHEGGARGAASARHPPRRRPSLLQDRRGAVLCRSRSSRRRTPTSRRSSQPTCPPSSRTTRRAQVPIVIYAHGGLVDQQIQLRDRPAAGRLVEGRENGVFPSTSSGRRPSARHCGMPSGAGRPAAGADGSMRRRTASSRRPPACCGSGGIWNDMKVDAAAASVDGGGGAKFAAGLGKSITEPTPTPSPCTRWATARARSSTRISSRGRWSRRQAPDRGVRDGELPRPRRNRRHLQQEAARAGEEGPHRTPRGVRHRQRRRTRLNCAHLQQVAPLPRLRLVRAAEVNDHLGLEKHLTTDAALGPFFNSPQRRADLVLAPLEPARVRRARRPRTAHSTMTHRRWRASRSASGQGDGDEVPGRQARARCIHGRPPATPRRRRPTPAPGRRFAWRRPSRLCIGIDRYPTRATGSRAVSPTRRRGRLRSVSRGSTSRSSSTVMRRATASCARSSTSSASRPR